MSLDIRNDERIITVAYDNVTLNQEAANKFVFITHPIMYFNTDRV